MKKSKNLDPNRTYMRSFLFFITLIPMNRKEQVTMARAG